MRHQEKVDLNDAVHVILYSMGMEKTPVKFNDEIFQRGIYNNKGLYPVLGNLLFDTNGGIPYSKGLEEQISLTKSTLMQWDKGNYWFTEGIEKYLIKDIKPKLTERDFNNLIYIGKQIRRQMDKRVD